MKRGSQQQKKTPRQLDREIAEALAQRNGRQSSSTHATKKDGTVPSRWAHRSIAQSYSVPDDVVRRIYATVQTAKKQGLYGGYAADLVERNVGRKLVGGEYDVYAKAKEHLDYDPPGGYGGPRPTGSAKEPVRAEYDDPKIGGAERIASKAERVIKGVLDKRRHTAFGWDWQKADEDRALLNEAADELEVAADLYEEAGAGVRGGTLRERARYARKVDYPRLASYSA